MSENQALLDAIRVIVNESVDKAVAPFSQKIDSLGQRFDTLTEQFELRVGRLEEAVERLDARTNQLSHDLFGLQEWMDRGFQALKSETTLALRDLDAVKKNQNADRKKIPEVEHKVIVLQQRLDALEQVQAAQSS